LVIEPKLLSTNTDYNREHDHFKLKEEINYIRIINPNLMRKKNEKYTIKNINKAKRVLKQTILDKYISIKKEKKEYW